MTVLSSYYACVPETSRNEDLYLRYMSPLYENKSPLMTNVPNHTTLYSTIHVDQVKTECYIKELVVDIVHVRCGLTWTKTDLCVASKTWKNFTPSLCAAEVPLLKRWSQACYFRCFHTPKHARSSSAENCHHWTCTRTGCCACHLARTPVKSRRHGRLVMTSSRQSTKIITRGSIRLESNRSGVTNICAHNPVGLFD